MRLVRELRRQVLVGRLGVGAPLPSIRELIAEKGLGQISDAGRLEEIITRIVADNPGPAEDFRQGKEKALGFFVGQVMKETRGQANPQMVNELLRRHLAG